jgi:hypothetical protein
VRRSLRRGHGTHLVSWLLHVAPGMGPTWRRGFFTQRVAWRLAHVGGTVFFLRRVFLHDGTHIGARVPLFPLRATLCDAAAPWLFFFCVLTRVFSLEVPIFRYPFYVLRLEFCFTSSFSYSRRRTNTCCPRVIQNSTFE